MTRDKIHEAVKNALIKDGWTITHDPYRLVYEGSLGWVDLAAKRPFAAKKGAEEILVEIKSFLNRSAIKDFQQALGQYLLYQSWLEMSESDYDLFLAISQFAYERVFSRPGLEHVRKHQHMPLVVVNLEREEIVEWIK